MTRTLNVVTRLRKPGLDRHAVEAAARKLVALATPLAKRRGRAVFDRLDIVLHGDKASAEAHRAVMGVPTPTDVITVSYAAVPGAPAAAELLVNPVEAHRQALRRDAAVLLPEERGLAWSPDLELALYIAHGIDHLCGSDDATPAGYRAMRRRELRWVRTLGPLSLFTEAPHA